jgi:quinol monooxygenase YgiN
MLILSVNLRVPKADQDRLRPEMEKVVQASRKEAGCLAYSYGFDLIEPDIIRVFEIYKDEAALKAHGESDHFKAWRAVSGQYPRENRTLYDASVKG